MDDVRGDFLGPPHGTTPAEDLGGLLLVGLHELLFKCVYHLAYRQRDWGFFLDSVLLASVLCTFSTEIWVPLWGTKWELYSK